MGKSRRKVVGIIYSSAKGGYVTKRVRQSTRTGDSRAKMRARGAARHARHLKHLHAGCGGKLRGDFSSGSMTRFCLKDLPEGQHLGDHHVPSRPWRNRKKSAKETSTMQTTHGSMVHASATTSYGSTRKTTRTERERGVWGDSYNW